MTTSHSEILVNKPPYLHPVSETQAFSGSTTSSGSSSYSAYLERLSRGSSGSAYLTDITPPSTPINLKSASIDSNYAWDKPQTCGIGDDESGEGVNGEVRDPFDIVATKLSRAMPSINSRRALEIMERRKGTLSNESSPDNSHSHSLAAARIIVTEHDIVQASQAEVQTTLFDEGPQTKSTLSFSEDRQPTSDISCYVSAIDHEHVVSRENSPPLFSPRLPPKPTLQATKLDSDCSPLLLSSPSLSASLSHLLVSPIPLITHSMAMSSPAIYSDCSLNGHSPDGSPLVAISTLMFSSRLSRRTSVMTGEDLDLPSLLRLEVAASIEGMPITQGGLGLAIPVQHRSPPLVNSFSSFYGNSFESCSLEDIGISDMGDTSQQLIPENPGTSMDRIVDFGMSAKSAVAVTSSTSEGHIIGLGLGSAVEGVLQSSASITRLDSILAQQDALALAEMRKDIINYTDPLPAAPDFQLSEEHTIPTVETLPRRKASFRPRKRLPHPSSDDCEPDGCETNNVSINPVVVDDKILSMPSEPTTERHVPSPLKSSAEFLHPFDAIAIQGRDHTSIKPRVVHNLLQPEPQVRHSHTDVSSIDEKMIPSTYSSAHSIRPLYIPRKSSFALLDTTSPKPELETFIRSGFSPFTLSSKGVLTSGSVDYFHESSYILGAEKYLSPSAYPLPLRHASASNSAAKSPRPSSSASPVVPGAAHGSYFVEVLSTPSAPCINNALQPQHSEPLLARLSSKTSTRKPKPFFRLFNFTKRWFPAKFRWRVRNLVMVPRSVAV